MGYSYYRPLTIDHTKCGSSNSTNFPVLFMGTYSWLATTGNGGRLTNSSGFDLIFAADSAGVTTYNYEVESYNATTGAVIIWINIPTVSASADTIFYILYGNSAITTFQGNVNGTWNSNYTAVIHFPTTGSTVGTTNCVDSTSNGNTPNTLQGSPTLVAGQIGQAYNGSGTQAVQIHGLTNPPTGSSPITIQCWFKHSAVPTTDRIPVSIGSTGTLTRFSPDFFSSTHASIDMSSGNAVYTYSSDNTTWHLVHCVYPSGAPNSNTSKFYIDGVAQSQSSSTTTGTMALPIAASSFLAIGCDANATTTANFQGSVDEARVSKIDLSADWILTEYNNQFSPSTFYSVGFEQQPGIGGFFEQISDRMAFFDGIKGFYSDPNAKLFLGDRLANLDDSFSIVDLISEKFADTLVIMTDALKFVVGIPIQAFDSQFFNWADNLNSQYIGALTNTEADTLILSDSVATIVRTVKIFLTLSDNFNTLSDAISTTRILQAIAASDNLVLSDVLIAQVNWLGKVADFMSTLADSAGFSLNVLPRFNDSVSMSDNVSLALAILLKKTLSDSLNLSDGSPLLNLVSAYNPSLILRIRRYLGDMVSGNAQPS